MIRVLDDPEALAAEAAEVIATTVRASVDGRGRCGLALAGGTTPVPTYRILAGRYRDTLPWDRVQIVFGDERLVPPDHRDSNFRSAREHLLRHVRVPDDSVHRVPTELGSVGEAADAYERTLWATFGRDEVHTPVLDLVLLGLGRDGHTASLMPGCSAIDERVRLVTTCSDESLDHPRVTASPRLLNAARRAMFLVSGGDKSEALRAVLEEAHDPHRLPAQIVRPSGREPDWLVDSDAAGDLGSASTGTTR